MRVLITLALLSMPVLGFAYQPFTSVQSVCETCPNPKSDVLTLNDGNKIRGSIIGENTAFYVMLKHLEVRAIQKTQVQTVEYAGGTKPGFLASQDQILLKSGHVLNGEITEDKEKPALFQVRSSHGNVSFVVFKSEVSKVYKKGLESSF